MKCFLKKLNQLEFLKDHVWIMSFCRIFNHVNGLGEHERLLKTNKQTEKNLTYPNF